MVMCNEPVTRTPLSGFSGAYFLRIDMRPGISCSAMDLVASPVGQRHVGELCRSVSFVIGVFIRVLKVVRRFRRLTQIFGRVRRPS